MLKPVSYPVRFLLWLWSMPNGRLIIGIVGVLLILAAVFPSAIYVYPVWKGTVRDHPESPFEAAERSIHTQIIRPDRVIPGQSYQLKIEIANLTSFAAPESVELFIWEDDPYVTFEQPITGTVIIQHTFPAGIQMAFAPDLVRFSVGNMEQPYRLTRFHLRLISPDGELKTDMSIPVDYYSIPVVALAAVVIPLIAGLLKLLFR